MKRISLNSLDQSDHIAIIMAHPIAGKYVAALIEDCADNGVLASYTIVFKGNTVCLRVPIHVGTQADGSHLLLWEGDHKSPWRVDSKLLPRDAAELRLLTLAVTTAHTTSPRLPSTRAA